MTKINISFSDLTHKEDSCKTIPYGVALVASYALKNFGDKINVDIFKYPNDFIKYLEQTTPQIVCFSNYIWNSNISYEFARRIKKKFPDTIIVFGGPNYPIKINEQEEFLLSHPDIDFYVYKEGEQAFVELLKKLFEYNFDVDKIKKDQINIPNTHYIHDGRIVVGDLLPRLTNLDEIPSPYLSGLCDKFLNQKLVPLIQVTRGCPFTCTYCQEGDKYFSKLQRFSSERIKDEIEYIAQRTITPTLEVADSNFGMYEEDITICKEIALIQKKYNWPKFFFGIDGKNCKDRILKATSLVGGSFLIAAVQSTDEQVLKNIKRKGISIDQMIQIAKEVEKMGSNSFSEVILGLPGDTKNAHFKSISELIDAGIDIVRSHQFIMLPGSEAATKESRGEFGMVTRFRVTPSTTETYQLFGEYFSAPEIDEICVANNSMSFDDYLECRRFNLTIEIFYNYSILQELLRFIKLHKISLVSFIENVHEQIHKSESLSKIYDDFLKETKELWENREELKTFLKQPGVIERYQSKELGNNEQLLYRSLAILNHIEDIHRLAFDTAKEMLFQEGHSNEQISNYLKELTEFNLLRKKDVFSTETVTKKTFHYDFISLLACNFNDDHLSHYKPEGINLLFSYTDEQKNFISKYLEIYGTSKNELAFILSTILRNDNPYRNVKLVNEGET